MDSIKTKIRSYSMHEGKAIAKVVIVPSMGAFRIYVAWEWAEMANNGFFAICKQNGLCKTIDSTDINYVANYGSDITDTQEAKELFPEFFK